MPLTSWPDYYGLPESGPPDMTRVLVGPMPAYWGAVAEVVRQAEQWEGHTVSNGDVLNYVDQPSLTRANTFRPSGPGVYALADSFDAAVTRLHERYGGRRFELRQHDGRFYFGEVAEPPEFRPLGYMPPSEDDEPDEYMDDDPPVSFDDDESDYCDCHECNPPRSEHSGYIHGYMHKPHWRLRGDGPVYLGTEIEIADYSADLDEAASIACDTLGDLGFLKSDGSIHPDGFELVTHPMAWSWARERFPWKLLPELRDAGMEANDSCGIHVHVARDAFTDAAHMFRWLALIYRNPLPLQWLAGRRDSTYAPWDDSVRALFYTTAKRGQQGHGRYNVINLNNESTVEVRMFASTLDPDIAQARYSLCDAMVEYTRNLTVPDIVQRVGWRFSSFAEWLEDDTESYGALRALVDDMPVRTRNARGRRRPAGMRSMHDRELEQLAHMRERAARAAHNRYATEPQPGDVNIDDLFRLVNGTRGGF